MAKREQKKVLWLIKGLGLGGAEKLLTLALPYLDRKRYDYEVAYLLPWKSALVQELEQGGIPVFCLNQRWVYDPRVLPRLVSFLRQRKVDLLHLHLPYSGILGRAASRWAPVSGVVYTEHNVWERYHWLTQRLNRWTFGWNDAVIAVSEEVERSIRARYHINGKTWLGTIHNGVDLGALSAVPRDPEGVRREFNVPPSHRLVVNVANFTPKKRHATLLAAARRMLDQDSAISFLLVGQGPLESVLRDEARSLGVEANVIFTGFRADATRLVAASDVFMLSSLYEGLPVSVLEAMALGTPVVATRVGGVPEVLTDGVNAFLVEPESPEQLADRTLMLLDNEALRRRIAESAQRKVNEQFDVRGMVRRVEAVYDRVLGKGRAV